MAFDIPAQPLAAALEAFSTRSRVQILYDSRLAGTRFSSPVQGLLPPETALRQLLSGTDLIGRFTAARDVVITTLEAEKRAEATPGGEGVAVVAGLFTLQTLRVEATPRARADYGAYAGVVQADLQRLLQGDRRTGKGRYRVGIKLWVKQTGEISRSEVFDSSGDLERDEVIAQVLANAMLSEGPPADMPQPIQVVISAWPV